MILLAASVKALWLRTPVDGIVLGMTAIVVCAGWRDLTFPHDYVREPAIALLLAFGSLLIGPYQPLQAARSEPADVPVHIGPHGPC
jgi:hypothetical protein